LPSGDYLFVITDEYSRYPIVEIIKSESATTVIPVLDKVISPFCIPNVIKTDNGSPFNSYAFRQYAEHIGFKHRRVLRKTDRKENKLTPAYEPNHYTVTNKKGNMITVTNENGLVTRNSS
jgi:transposase InsO family protein